MKRLSRETPTALRRRKRRITAAASGIALGVLCCTLAPPAADAASASKKGKAPGLALYKKAEASFTRKDYAGTLALLTKAEAAGGVPKADVLNLRGAVHLRQRDFDKAREEFSAAASADRSLLAARYNLAEVDFEQGRYAESRRRLAGLVGRAKGRNEKDFFQYKVLLADLLNGKEETAVRYLSEHRGDPGKPSAEFCYLSAALAYRQGKPDEARRWAARVPKRAPQPVKRLFAASLDKFGPRLSASDRATDSLAASSETGANLAKTPPAKPSFREGRNEPDTEPTRGSGSASAGVMASGGGTGDGSGASDGSASPAAVAMVQIMPEPNGSAPSAARSASVSSASRASSSLGNSGSAPAAKPRAENATEDTVPSAMPKFRYGETSATDSDYLLAAASPTPKPTPSAGAGPKPAAASSGSAAASPSASAAAKPSPPPVPTPEPPTEAFNQKYETAFIAFSKRDYNGALQSLKEADAIQPGQADPANLRGLIYARQRQFEQAEVEFKRAVQLDPTFWAAKFNLADLPFTYRNYGLARGRFEALLAEIDPTALPREVELTQFKIFLTLLLEGKEASARAFMSRFKFEGTTPARLYAQAALDFHDGNFERAVSWMESAKKQFPPQLEALFAESFFRIGWLTNTPGLAQADPATGGAAAASSSPSPPPTPGLSLAPAPNLPVPPPVLETGETPTTTGGSTAITTLSLAPAAATPTAVAAPTQTPVEVAAAAASPPAPTPGPTPSPSPSPVLVAQATPAPAVPETTPAPLPTATPAAPRIAAAPTPAARPTAASVVAPPEEVPEQGWTDRLIRVILPAFVALYVLFTPFFILGAVLMRKKRSRKSRQIKVPLAYPSGKLARQSKSESTS